MACHKLIPSCKATTNVTSELRGKIVAAKKAERKRAISAMLTPLKTLQYLLTPLQSASRALRATSMLYAA